ncbi:hypothetical protein F511_39911 [Dorcoceras hygrometricum]|uniref:Uncharacterized protein n=1 Tax=Dorcoceras hygrometricum TaxID=472368 RepID=A0A2Z7D9Z9_9LAMI|nr:hypothetical protein F511_39911 [Dorcoceras hygrometricum]
MASSLISNNHHVDFDSVFGMDDATITQMFELLIATRNHLFRQSLISYSSEMASSLISNNHHVDFDSVFGMDDATITQMFELLIATRLKDFLCCPAVYYEAALIEVFENGSVREDGVVVSTIRGINVEISKGMFATAFGLPTEGLTDVSDVPNDLVFDARSLFSESEEQQEKQDSEEEIDFDVAKTGEEARSSKHHPEELMSLDDLLIQISEDTMLPSVTVAEITKIRLGESINIQEVQDRDVYYASLPRIFVHDKGKEPLVEDEPVKGNPAREYVELICGDVEFLVRLRDQVMVDVVEFFHSFSLNKLPDSDSLKILKEKEKLMLEWAGTDSFETAVKRRLYILAKYREMLLRKFLESHRKYLVPGQPWTATASQIIDLLSAAHSKSLEVLVTQQRENGLPIEQPCTSTYLDTSIGSGVVLAQFFSQAKSKCWVRPMVQIDGLWTLVQGPEFLRSSCKLSLFVNKRQVPTSVVVEDFVPHGCLIEPFQYWEDAPSLIKTWGWARVCTDVVRYHMFVCLRYVCKDIVVYNLGVERIPDYLLDVFEQGVNTDTFVAYFSSSRAQSSPEIDSDSSDESPPRLFLSQDSTSSSSDSQMNFDDTDTAAPAPTISQLCFSNASPDITEAIQQLRTSLDLISNQDNGAALKDVILLHLHDIEKKFTTRLDAQDRWFGTLRKDSNDQRNLLSLEIKSSQRQINTQISAATLDQIDMQREVKELNAKVDAMATNLEILRRNAEETKEAISHQLLEFQAKIAADILSLSIQIGELVDHIRGGDAKKGEIGSSSRRPPPVRVERRPLPTQANQGESSSGHGRVPSMEEAAKMVREADRQADRRETEKEREKRLRRLRRRGH